MRQSAKPVVLFVTLETNERRPLPFAGKTAFLRTKLVALEISDVPLVSLNVPTTVEPNCTFAETPTTPLSRNCVSYSRTQPDFPVRSSVTAVETLNVAAVALEGLCNARPLIAGVDVVQVPEV